MTDISASILSADFANLALVVKRLNDAGVDYIHCDVMDGVFVPNLTFGSLVIQAIKPYSVVPLDVHLMVEKPAVLLDDFLNAGSDLITFHLECDDDLNILIERVKKANRKVGISINPSTSVQKLASFIEKIDFVLIMSVNPGFGGQKFIKKTAQKISQIRKMRSDVRIHIDGGINAETRKYCAEADVFVVGNALIKSENWKKTVKELSCPIS